MWCLLQRDIEFQTEISHQALTRSSVAKIPTRRRCLWNVWCTGVLVWRRHGCVGLWWFFRQLLSQNQRQSQDQPFGFYPSYTQRIYLPFWVCNVYTLHQFIYYCVCMRYRQMAIFGRLVLSREFKGDLREFTFPSGGGLWSKHKFTRQLCQVSWSAIVIV